MSPCTLLVSLIVLVSLLANQSLSVPLCPVTPQSQDGNPLGWPSDWGYVSTGAYAPPLLSDQYTKNYKQVFKMCESGGCGPACCWHANGFAFWAEGSGDDPILEETSLNCMVNINFNGDSRYYVVNLLKLGAINYVSVDGWMANYGNWVYADITCTVKAIRLFNLSENAWFQDTCGGLLWPSPICSWVPTIQTTINLWAAFYMDCQCNTEEMMMAYSNSTEPRELPLETFMTCTPLFE